MTSYEDSHKSAHGHTLLTNGRKFMTNGVFLPMKQTEKALANVDLQGLKQL